MASNALASIAAATAAGYTLLRWTRTNGQNVTDLEARPVGQPGQSVTGKLTFQGEGASAGAADTVALANLNAWRANRYGSDSAGVNVATYPSQNPGGAGPVDKQPTHSQLTKDRN